MSMLLALLQLAGAIPPAPPIISRGRPPHAAPSTPGDLRRLLSAQPSAVQCDGGAVRLVHNEAALPVVRLGDARLPAIEVKFRIDAEGRPLGIRSNALHRLPLPDLLPSFATWRFAAGEPRGDCSITFYPNVEPFRSADPDTLTRFLAFGGGHPYRERVAIERIAPSGSNCLRRWPPVLVQVHPWLDKIPARPGALAATMVAFDIAEDGSVENARAIAGDRHQPLDRAAAEAVAQWQYAEGPRQGCLFPVRRENKAIIAAPPPADTQAPCALDDEWGTPPDLVYPEPYRRRGIEGWAVVGYDVAPWGELGNLRVLAAEPTAEFGEAALKVVRSGRKPPSGGATGCTDLVLFRLPRPD